MIQTYIVDIYRTEVSRTTVQIPAENPESAAKTADDIDYKLPLEETWIKIGGSWRYLVRAPGSREVLYEGDAGEFT